MILLWPSFAGAQKVKPLKIGERAPDIVISNVYNSYSSIIHSFDLEGKLIILDFMATTCVPCVKVLPRFDSLQKQYGKSLQIILVSPEKAERIQTFLKMHPSLHLPLAADSNCAKYFPHTYISHVAWINPNGVVCAITHTEYVNSENIQSVLNGQNINWHVKRDIPDYDYSQPMFQLNKTHLPDEAKPVHYYYTSIISYLPGVQKYIKITEDSVQNSTHLLLVNFSLLELYKILFRRFQIPLSHILLDEKSKTQLIYNPALEYFEMWKRENVHCLEGTLPSRIPAEQQMKKLIQDIGFYFGLNASLKKRSVECMVLKNKAGSGKKSLIQDGLTMGSVVGTLNNQLGAMPVIDETHGTVYLKLPIIEKEVTDSLYLQKTLNDYGIAITTETREIEFLIINQSTMIENQINNLKN